uniref:Uncharacterized protein n=1 Tax=viral metagenome TaxID=1070528 RepID=A0A6C0J5X6_9ZZZZ
MSSEKATNDLFNFIDLHKSNPSKVYNKLIILKGKRLKKYFDTLYIEMICYHKNVIHNMTILYPDKFKHVY